MRYPRFVKEYANYQIRTLESNELMQKKYKDHGKQNCTQTLKLLDRGFITVNEAMKAINNCLDGCERL